MLHDFSDPEQQCTCRFCWIQWQRFKCFFIERIFDFFMTLFLKKMGIMSSASKRHCHSRLSKTILKILSIYRKNISWKQVSQAICSKYLFRLLHATKFQIFSIKLYMVKVVELFTGVLWKSRPDEFYRKHLYRNLFFDKERLLHRFFSVSFTKYFTTWLLLLNTFFCSLNWPQPQKFLSISVEEVSKWYV